ncbi:baseplate J/gp47 family protein, partial [Methylobacterium sp. E-066]|uniref:baseplate J/gp47 family protein n=1 Tax=Methylobacterium sp. E-066 TaxID=2836584 RepID=UPI001FB9AAE9
MAGYSVRSLTELSQAARKYFTQSIDGAVASVWANTFTVLAKVLALVGQGLELRRAWLVRQLFASTADRLWLIRHGFELDLQPFPADTALGSATFPAAPGVAVPAGLQFARADGATFTSVAAVTPTGSTVSLSIEADVAGSAGNTDGGTALTLVDVDDAPAGFGGAGTVDAAADGSGLAGGADAEETEAF